MTIVSHTLLTTIGVQVLNLHGWEIVLAFLFGVVIDIDHIFKVPAYCKKHKFKIKDIFKKKIPREKQYHWRTFLQEPISLLWIIPLSIIINSIIPIVFFLGHVLLDYLINYRKFPFSPLSNFSTIGFFPNISNKRKEVLTIIILSLILIILLLKNNV